MDALQRYKLNPKSPTAQEDLYVKYRPLLYRFAWRYAERDCAIDAEDLMHEGFFGLLEAAEKYDPAGGKSFKRYAAWYINRRMQKALCMRHYIGEDGKQHVADKPQNLRFDAPISEEAETTLLEVTADENAILPEENAVDAYVRDTLKECVSQLPEKQKQITERHYYGRQDLKKAADALGITYSAAYDAHGQALVNLRKMYPVRTICEELDYYGGVSVASFNRTHMSQTEYLALRELGEIPIPTLVTTEKQRKNRQMAARSLKGNNGKG